MYMYKVDDVGRQMNADIEVSGYQGYRQMGWK